jgi:hypothetical protein
MEMSQTRVLVLLAGTALSFGAGTALAGDPDQTSDRDRAYAAELKADAAMRTSMLAAEGDSNVKLGGFGQFRYYMNFRDDPASSPGSHDSGFTNGFEATRTRLQATGNIMSKDFTFKIEGDFNQMGFFTLLDAYGNFNFGNGSSITIGQWQHPMWREWSLSPKGQLAADVSVVTAIFNPGYTQGIGYQWRGDAFGFFVSGNDGFNSGNTPYTTPGPTGVTSTGAPVATVGPPGEADYGVSARFEFKGGGGWEQFDEFTSWRGNPMMWLVGASAHAQFNGNTAATPASAVQFSSYNFAVDAMFKGNGWNAYGAVIAQLVDPSAGDSALDFGAVAQAGIFVTENLELFGRWDGVFPDSDRSGDDMFSTVCAGVNFYPYPKSNAVKFTGDVQWFLNEPTTNDLVNSFAFTDPNVVGLRPDANSDQFAIRLQFQWMF